MSCTQESSVFANLLLLPLTPLPTVPVHSLKTSFFKRSPDYDSAAEQYARAATCYKTIKKTDKCIQCHLKAADCYKSNRSYYSAAK